MNKITKAWRNLDLLVAKAIEEKKVCGLLLTDQSNAFNLEKKEKIIMKKLSMMGVKHMSQILISSYLTGLRTCCHVGQTTSSNILLHLEFVRGVCLADVTITARRVVKNLTIFIS